MTKCKRIGGKGARTRYVMELSCLEFGLLRALLGRIPGTAQSSAESVAGDIWNTMDVFGARDPQISIDVDGELLHVRFVGKRR